MRFADVAATGWLNYIGRMLGGAAAIVRSVAQERRSAIVHCSDGSAA